MCTSDFTHNGHHYSCVMNEPGCTAHAADSIDGDILTWTD